MQHTIHRIILAVWAIVLILPLTGSAAGVRAPQKANSLRQQEVMELLQSGMASRQVCKTIDDRGIDFDLTLSVERRVRQAGGTDDVVAALKRASQLRSENGKPQTGVLVIKTNPGESEIYLDTELKGKSSRNGEIRLPGLPPGNYLLRVSSPGYQSYESTRTVAAGDEQTVIVNLAQTSAAGSEMKTPPAGHEATTPSSALPIPNAKLSPVQFYEGPVDQTLEKSQREYRSSFDRFTARAVYWELDISYPPPGRRIDFHVDVIWYKADGTEMDRQAVSAFVLPDWGSSWETLGFGYREPGHWLPGTYRIEILFRNTRIAGGTFQIN